MSHLDFSSVAGCPVRRCFAGLSTPVYKRFYERFYELIYKCPSYKNSLLTPQKTQPRVNNTCAVISIAAYLPTGGAAGEIHDVQPMSYPRPQGVTIRPHKPAWPSRARPQTVTVEPVLETLLHTMRATFRHLCGEFPCRHREQSLCDAFSSDIPIAAGSKYQATKRHFSSANVKAGPNHSEMTGH
jgi:hypothetical protein